MKEEEGIREGEGGSRSGGGQEWCLSVVKQSLRLAFKANARERGKQSARPPRPGLQCKVRQGG